MKKLFLAVGLVTLIGAGCAQQSPLSDTSTTATTPVPEAPTNNPGANGPAHHSLQIARSADGVEWDLQEEPLVEAASVPDMITLERDASDFTSGTILSYFVDASDFQNPGDEKIGLISSTDNGDTWSDVTTITITGAEEQTPVDPSITQLEDGRLRMHYYDFPASPSPAHDSVFYSAVSEDGLNFEVEGAALEVEGTATDPDVHFYEDRWYMYYAKPTDETDRRALVATSTDGIYFEGEERIEVEGIPGSMILGDEITVWGCGNGGIYYGSSSDGSTFVENEAISIPTPPSKIMCDPAPVRTADGSYLLMVKTAEVTEPKNSPDGEPMQPLDPLPIQ